MEMGEGKEMTDDIVDFAAEGTSSKMLMELMNDDKEIATKAVTLVISSARKGLVGLCSSVALLLKENENLERQLRNLQLNSLEENEEKDVRDKEEENGAKRKKMKKRVASPKTQFESDKKKGKRSGQIKTERRLNETQTTMTTVIVHRASPPTPSSVTHIQDEQDLIGCCHGEVDRNVNDFECDSSRYWRNRYEVLKQMAQNESETKEADGELGSNGRAIPVSCPSPLFECVCSDCGVRLRTEYEKRGESARVFTLTRGGRRILEIDDRVMISENRVGSVRYVGHLDGVSNPSVIFVGVRLDSRKGNTDGRFGSKQYFVCGRNFGVFVPLHEVLFLVARNDKCV